MIKILENKRQPWLTLTNMWNHLPMEAIYVRYNQLLATKAKNRDPYQDVMTANGQQFFIFLLW